MPLLFTQDWDVVRGREDEYEEFVGKKFIPRCNALGLVGVGGFQVQTGFGPGIISLKKVESMQQLSSILESEDFKALKIELRTYVQNYTSKVLQPTGRIKKKDYTIQKGVWKFNQYYDIIPGMRDQYIDYIYKTYIPTIEAIDYVELTGAWNVLIGGLSEIISEFTVRDPIDIGRLLGNDRFREVTYTLQKEFVTNYKSRILRTTARFDEPRWFRL